MFLYTTSFGKINICDLRERSDFHKRPSLLLETVTKGSKLSSNVFSKWTNSVAQARFVPNSNFLVSRDYLSVKLWDMRAASSDILHPGSSCKPIYSSQVTDYVERNLGTLLENDSLED